MKGTKSRKVYDFDVVVSYSGGNIGVDYSFKNDLKKYMLSKNERENIISLKYAVNETEFSYISI